MDCSQKTGAGLSFSVPLSIWGFSDGGRSVTTHMSQCMVRTDGSVPMSMCHVYLLYHFFCQPLCYVSDGMCYVLVLHFNIFFHFITHIISYYHLFT